MNSQTNYLSWEDAVRWLKAQPELGQLSRDCFFDDPLLEAAERYYSGAEWVAVRKLIGVNGGHALDLGAGRGISSYALARDGWQTTALEPDPSDEVGSGAIRRLVRESGKSVRVVENWGEELPFDANSFELVHCRQVLHHARDLRKLCLEAARVLKPGGMLLATREHVLSKKSDLAPFLNSHPLHDLYGGENAFTLNQYVEAITLAGIRLCNVFNPLQSDINTFPRTREMVKAEFASKFKMPGWFIPGSVLSWWGSRIDTPGRLYSFFGRKAIAANKL